MYLHKLISNENKFIETNIAIASIVKYLKEKINKFITKLK